MQPARVRPFEPPPRSLDLLTAPDEALRRHGIPPRPDCGTQPLLRASWERLFVPRPLFVDPSPMEVADVTTILPRQTPGSGASPPVSATRFESSRNWSGAYVEPSGGRTFLQVAGRWTVPTPRVPADAAPPAEGSVVYASSCWVGLDGQRAYLDSSLPQTGTWQAVTLAADGTQSVETYAWFQWWAKDGTDILPARIENVPVAPGDEVACLVRAWSASSVVICFRNLSTNRIAVFLVDAPTRVMPDGTVHTFTISGATAEWVVERPLGIESHELYPLADFGAVDLTECHAAAANVHEPGWPFVVGVGHALEGGRFIRMFEPLDEPPHTRFIAMPWRLGEAAVRVRFGDAMQ
jgi:hypothetical protein